MIGVCPAKARFRVRAPVVPNNVHGCSFRVKGTVCTLNPYWYNEYD